MAKIVTVQGGEKLNRTINRLLRGKQVYAGYDVGIFANSTHLPPDRRKKHSANKGQKAAVSTAVIAIAHEFGVPKKGIPRRPFFRIGNEKAKWVLSEEIRRMLSLDENYVLTKRDMERLGIAHQAEVQKALTDLKTPPNSPETIRIKKSSNPLIDTGQLRRSITYKVVE